MLLDVQNLLSADQVILPKVTVCSDVYFVVAAPDNSKSRKTWHPCTGKRWEWKRYNNSYPCPWLIMTINEGGSLKSVLKLLEKLDFLDLLEKFLVCFVGLVGWFCWHFFFVSKGDFENDKTIWKVIRLRTSENICSAETCTLFWKYLSHRIISERGLLSGNNPDFMILPEALCSMAIISQITETSTF